MIESGVTEVWIDRVVKDDDSTFSYMPTILNLANGKDQVDPDELYTEVNNYAKERMSALPSAKESKKKYKKAYEKAQSKIRERMDKALDKKDKTTSRAVLCRFD